MLAIDPGAFPGFALFDDEDNELSECSHYFKEAYTNELMIVCEQPTIYPRSKADPNRIITLAITAGRLIERCSNENCSIEMVLPRSWKGQLPKTPKLKDYIIYKRVCKALNEEELEEFLRALAEAPAKAGFDITDAVGIGLHHLGRL